MKNIGIGSILIVIAIAFTFVYVRTQPPGTHATLPANSAAKQQLAYENTVTTQQRLNRHFHGDVVPKLKECWGRIKGKGTIDFKYGYTKTRDGRWMFGTLAVEGSTLPAGQDAVALKCMQDSSRGGSFAAGESDAKEATYTLHWRWPVPFPADADQQRDKMFAAVIKGGGGLGESGGCDGQGTIAKCSSCDKDTYGCQKVCVGYSSCITFTDKYNPGLKQCRSEGACASGSPFSVLGGGGGYITQVLTPMHEFAIEMFDPRGDSE